MPQPKKVLISTIFADGGVETMTRKTVDLVTAAGFEVALAYYMPYRLASDLSVPTWRLLDRRPTRRTTHRLGVRAYEIGVRLPEFEWSRGLASRQWRGLIDSHDIHVAVCGSILAALPPLLADKPCLAWVATPYFDDRKDRRKSFPPLRRLLDTAFDTPVCRMLEKWALRKAEVLSLSRYTEAALHHLEPSASITRMPMAIDPSVYSPPPPKAPDTSANPVRRIGFAGRYDDPRKNIRLLIDAVGVARQRGLNVVLELVGGKRTPELENYARASGHGEHIKFRGTLSDELPDFYRSLDVFVIPSMQEGLAIVGLEAMASGCPVVSTRCGGPEEYVIDGVNGFLVPFDATQMANAVASLLEAPERRATFSQMAVKTVRENYSEDVVAATFWRTFQKTFGTTRAIDD